MSRPDRLCSRLVQVDTVNSQVLAAENAKLSPSDLDKVILVGRATRMPHVRSLLAEYFGRGESLLSYAVR